MTTRPGTSAPTPARLAEAHRRSQALVARCGLPVPADLPPRCHLDALVESELRSAAWAAADRLRARGLRGVSEWANLAILVQIGDRATCEYVIALEATP